MGPTKCFLRPALLPGHDLSPSWELPQPLGQPVCVLCSWALARSGARSGGPPPHLPRRITLAFHSRAALVTTGWPPSGRLPTKLLIPVISQIVLLGRYSKRTKFKKPLSLWCPTRCGRARRFRNQQVRWFVSSLSCHSNVTLKSVPKVEIKFCHAFDPV